jgi:hypothetical protein
MLFAAGVIGRRRRAHRDRSNGGLRVGGHRLPVRLKIVDDGTDRQRAADLDFLLGSFTSPLIESQSAAAEKLKVPYVTSSGTATSLYQRGFRYLFSVSAPTDQLANALMRWIDEEEPQGDLVRRVRAGKGGAGRAAARRDRLRGLGRVVGPAGGHQRPGQVLRGSLQGQVRARPRVVRGPGLRISAGAVRGRREGGATAAQVQQ